LASWGGRIVETFTPKRVSEIIRSVRRILKTDANDPDAIGKTIVQEANQLKGLPRKCAQLMGDRVDLVENEDIRKHLRSLQADCEKRPQAVVQQQIKTLAPHLQISEIVKAGTIGEVSKVLDPHEPNKCFAVKTVNPDSQELFEKDFSMLDSYILQAIKVLLDRAPLPGDTLKQVKAILDNLFNSLLNPGFRRNLLGEFDLAQEKNNLDEAHERLSQELLPHGQLKLMVPRTLSVSDDGKILMMEWIFGKNITDYVAAEAMQNPPNEEHSSFLASLLRALVSYYFRGLLVHRKLHRDLHPGNIIIHDSLDVAYVVDMGSELEPEAGHLPAIASLLHHVHCEDEQDDAKHKKLWLELGVTSCKDGDEQFRYISKSFDLIAGTTGLNLKENTENTKLLSLPPWVLLWQSASSAMVMTLQMLQKLPCSSQVNVREIVREVLSDIINTQGFTL